MNKCINTNAICGRSFLKKKLDSIRGTQGATLTELLLVLAIVSLILTQAAPSFSYLISSLRANSNEKTIYQHLQLARSTAISSATNVILCSEHNNRCQANYEDNITLFTDVNNNREPEVDEILLQFNLDSRDEWRKSGTSKYVGFDPRGHLLGGSGSFLICSRQPQFNQTEINQLARMIIFSRSGRVRMAKDSNQDNIDESASGVPLSCP